MQLLLVKDGVLENLCIEVDEQSSCPHQLTALNFIYTVGTTASIFGTAIGGYLIDHHGFVVTCYISGFLNTSGMIILAMAPRESLVMFSIGSAFIGAGGILTFMCTFKVGFSVNSQNMTIVLSMSNCLFDCSGVVFLIFLSFYEMGLSRRYLFISYAIFSAIFFLLYASLWIARIKFETEQRYISIGEHCKSCENNCCDNPNHRRLVRSGNSICREKAIPFQQLKWSEQLFSYPFFYILMFTAIMMLKSNFYLGTAQIMLQQYGDQYDDYYYTRLLPAMLPLGVLFILIIDKLMSKYGFATMFEIICVLGMIFGSISLIPRLDIQIYAFFTYTAFRAFLYSAIATFNGHVFGAQNVGCLHGLSFCCAGILGFSQPLIVMWIMSYCGGNMFVVNLSLVLVCIPVIFETERGLRIFLKTIGDIKTGDAKCILECIDIETVDSLYNSTHS